MVGNDDHKDGETPLGWAAQASEAVAGQAQAFAGQAQAFAGQAGAAIAGVASHLGLGEQDAAAPHEQLDLSENDRLPWLESSQDEEEYVGVDSRRVFGAVAGMLALLAAIVGGIWWFTHRNGNGTQIADGSTIAAPAGPYKEAPKDPGGKTYDGTGDSSYAVSQGQSRPAHLAENAASGVAATASAAAEAAASAAASASTSAAQHGTAAVAAAVAPVTAASHAAAAAASAPAYSGGVVQVGAYTSQSSAETGWNRLLKQTSALAGVQHRIVEGKADIGTVYRLQALTGAGGGSALCNKLHGEGVACQVKH